MKVKVFQSNHNGKIEFTRAELERLLNEVYNDGYNEGKNSNTWTWTSPYYTSTTLLSDKTPINHATISCDTAKIDTEQLNKIAGTNTSTKVETNNDNNKTICANNANAVKPYTITLDWNQADINKAAQVLSEMLTGHGVISSTKTDDAFSKLAKELNF